MRLVAIVAPFLRRLWLLGRSTTPPARVSVLLLLQHRADPLRFLPPLRVSFWVSRLQVLERIDDDLRHDQPRIALVIGRNDVPGCVFGAGGAQAVLISGHVVVPKRSLLNIRHAELPVLLRLFDAREKALPLFLLRQM